MVVLVVVMVRIEIQGARAGKVSVLQCFLFSRISEIRGGKVNVLSLFFQRQKENARVFCVGRVCLDDGMQPGDPSDGTCDCLGNEGCTRRLGRRRGL